MLLLHSSAAGDVSCTSTLVAPNLVVTALHCVARAGAPGFNCTKEGELVPNPIGAGTLGSHLDPASIEFHAGERVSAEPVARGIKILSTFSETVCKNDIAFVVLDRELDLPIRPIRLRKSTAIGESMTFIGYGLDEQRIANWRDRPRKRLPGQLVKDAGPDSVQQGVQNAPPRTLIFEGPSSCLGDSGGPALSEDTGAVVGVFSTLSSALCSVRGVLTYTRVSPFGVLADQAFAAAGQPAWLDGEPDPRLTPNGASCAEAHECQSGACARGLCASACSADAPCPGGYTCEAESSACVKEPTNREPQSCSVAVQSSRKDVAALFLLTLCALARARRRSRYR